LRIQDLSCVFAFGIAGYSVNRYRAGREFHVWLVEESWRASMVRVGELDTGEDKTEAHSLLVA